MSLDTPYLYLGLMAFSLFGPLLRSFESRIAYYRSFKALFAGIALTMLVFIPWDIYFTAQGYWGFNERYLSGIQIANLPLGEWLFFIVIPFSCLFIYRVLNYFWPKAWISEARARQIASFLMWFSFTVAIISWGQWYTVSAFGLLGFLLGFHLYVVEVTWLGNFFRAYIVILIPFLLVNGILTGLFIEDQVVWYDDTMNLGKRLLTIPFDDIFYGMGLILMNVAWYEYLSEKWGISLTSSVHQD